MALSSSRGISTTCEMTAAPSSGNDDVSASLSRGEWLRVGASLAAIAPVLVFGKDNEAMAATSSGRCLRRPKRDSLAAGSVHDTAVVSAGF